MAATITQLGGTLEAGFHLNAQVWTYNALNQIGLVNLSYYVIAKAGFGDIHLGDAAQSISDDLFSHFIGLMDNGSTYLGVKVMRRTPAPQPLPGIAEDIQSGAGGADAVPGQVAGICTFHTTLAGPRYRGRIYLPFLATAMLDANSKPSNAAVVLMNALQVKYRTPSQIVVGGATADLQPEIYHRSDASGTPITAGFARYKTATQRRRGQYGRLNDPTIS